MNFSELSLVFYKKILSKREPAPNFCDYMDERSKAFPESLVKYDKRRYYKIL